MNYRIEEKAAFEVFGLELQTNVVNGKCYKDIPAFWQSCEKNGGCVALAQAAGKKPGELLDFGMTYAHEPNGNMCYMIACLKQTEVVPAEFKVLTIPKQTWAVFSTVWKSEQDTDKLHVVWRRIYSEWFPTANYEHADCDFDMEVYFGSDPSSYGVEVWIPVVKK